MSNTFFVTAPLFHVRVYLTRQPYGRRVKTELRGEGRVFLVDACVCLAPGSVLHCGLRRTRVISLRRINSHGSYLALNHITSHPFWVGVQCNCCNFWAKAEPYFFFTGSLYTFGAVCWLTVKSGLHSFYCWITKLFLNRNAWFAPPLSFFILFTVSQQWISWHPHSSIPFRDTVFLPLIILPFYCTLQYHISTFLLIQMSHLICCAHFHNWTDTNWSVCVCVCVGTQLWWCPSCTTLPIAPRRESQWWSPLCGSWPSLCPVPCCLASTPQVSSVHQSIFLAIPTG